MHTTSRRSSHRHFVPVTLLGSVLITMVATGGCSSEPPGPSQAGGPTTTTSGTTAGTTTSGTTAGTTTYGTTTDTTTYGTTTDTTTDGTTGLGSGGQINMGTGGGPGSGGAGATSSGGSGSGGEAPCVDVEPPPDPNWPGATCLNWALETTACSEDWFSNYCDASCERCVPEGGSVLPQPPDCSGENLPNVSGGEGHTTRYWDCCQTHCGQSSGHRCSQDGTSITGSNQSVCAGGNSFACYDEAPRAVSECLAYGHIAKANPQCGSCFRIQFTGVGNDNPNDIGSKLIQGKQMIVKVTNTGSDVGGTQFDLMVPGGGVGMFDGCTQQWGGMVGDRYGGLLKSCSDQHTDYNARKDCVRSGCMNIPAGDARDGCIWFVDWFNIADNPRFTSEPTNCPF